MAVFDYRMKSPTPKKNGKNKKPRNATYTNFKEFTN